MYATQDDKKRMNVTAMSPRPSRGKDNSNAMGK